MGKNNQLPPIFQSNADLDHLGLALVTRASEVKELNMPVFNFGNAPVEA